jgi:polyferredoxin
MMNFRFDVQKVTHWRLLIQWLFFGWCLFLGVQFSLFVRHFESYGLRGYFSRPPGVEGFLPIGALVSLKSWLTSGLIDPVHPAALILFLTFFAMAFVAKKSFCSYICPVGTLSEFGWKMGQRLFGRNYRILKELDILLQFAKYALLLFFVKLILIDMPTVALQSFLAAPYWAIADVKMLHFFTDMSRTSMIVIGALSLLSVIYKNFWCRYLCPYGALHGLVSMLSPFKIRRDSHHCTDCGRCSRVCPSLIDVQTKSRVHSPECTACLTCVSNCPEPGALQASFWQRPLPAWSCVLIVMLLFAAGVASGMLSGHWQTSLTYSDYQQLIPMAARLGH